MMSLTPQDLEAISSLIDSKLAEQNKRIEKNLIHLEKNVLKELNSQTAEIHQIILNVIGTADEHFASKKEVAELRSHLGLVS